MRRYLHAAAFWLAIAVISGFVTLQVLSGNAFANGQTLLSVLLPCLVVMILGIGSLWLALAQGGIRGTGALLAIGVLAGFALAAGSAFAVSYARREPQLWLLVLVPGNVVGGAIAAAYLAHRAAPDPDFWPSRPTW